MENHTNTSSESQAVAVAQPRSPVAFGKLGVQLSSLEDAYRFATAVSKSGFAPKGMESVESILIAVQFGAELGMTPMSALQSLAIVNGRPSIFGDAALALVRGSGLLEDYKQSMSGEGDAMAAKVAVKRKGEDAVSQTFSVADAKKAGLWGKAGPWTQYPTRMLMWRARGFALRDGFGDVLRGLRTSEEVEDMPPIKDVTPAPRARVPKEAPKALPEAAEGLIQTAAGGSESPAEPTAAESAKTSEGAAQTLSPADRLSILLGDAGLTFMDIKPIIRPNRLCASNAELVDDLSDNNAEKIIADFKIIADAALAEKRSVAP